MKLGAAILKIINKKYEPDSTVNSSFKRYDLKFKTDVDGNPILLFLGKMNGNGTIKGERFVRVLKTDSEGNIIKDHWECKGKTG